MKLNFSFKFFSALILAISIAMLSSCEKEIYSPLDDNNSSNISIDNDLKKGKGKGKGRNNQNEPPVEPPSDPAGVTYQLFQADDFDPLFRFSISQSGDLIYLETDPTITSWGTNYWGYWSDPFTYSNNEVNYIIGLTNTTYQFQWLPDNTVDVTKTLIVQPYPIGTPTTTITNPGIYSLVN